MSVSNGAIQTIVQGHHDETDMLPNLVAESTNDDVMLVSTPLLVANTSLSEDGGESDSGRNDESQGGSGQDAGGSTEIDEQPYVSPTRSPPLTASGCHSAWYAPATSSDTAAPPPYVPFPDTSAIPTAMYDWGTN